MSTAAKPDHVPARMDFPYQPCRAKVARRFYGSRRRKVLANRITRSADGKRHHSGRIAQLTVTIPEKLWPATAHLNRNVPAFVNLRHFMPPKPTLRPGSLIVAAGVTLWFDELMNCTA